jgi:hypothetical protein
MAALQVAGSREFMKHLAGLFRDVSSSEDSNLHTGNAHRMARELPF